MTSTTTNTLRNYAVGSISTGNNITCDIGFNRCPIAATVPCAAHANSYRSAADTTTRNGT
jgi:hypothetical protein